MSDPVFGAASGSRASTESVFPVSALTGFDPGEGAAYKLLNDPAGQAAFMLPRLDEAQRDFILRMKPTLANQRISKRDHEAVWPGVQTGEEWPDQFWFGGGWAHYPAGRAPLGNKRCSYGFRFYEQGLLLRDALARIETDRPRRETGSVRSMRAGSASTNTTPTSQDTDQ